MKDFKRFQTSEIQWLKMFQYSAAKKRSENLIQAAMKSVGRKNRISRKLLGFSSTNQVSRKQRRYKDENWNFSNSER